MSDDARQPRIVTPTQGRTTWAEAAFDVLRETAACYGATITYSALAEEVQARTGLTTNADQRNWIGKVLADVVHRCQREDAPHLTALVVHKHDGQVGPGYAEVLRVTGRAAIEGPLAREQHAAETRLECYRRYCEHVPDGAVPELTPAHRTRVERQRRSRPQTPRPTCPHCWVELPAAGGACQNC